MDQSASFVDDPAVAVEDTPGTYSGPHIYITLDEQDQNQVLELVRSDDDGMFIRDNESWVPINIEDDNPRVWDRVIVDLTENAVQAYDEAESEGKPITADMFTGYELPEDNEGSAQ